MDTRIDESEATPGDKPTFPDALTEREVDVLRLVVKGHSGSYVVAVAFHLVSHSIAVSEHFTENLSKPSSLGDDLFHPILL